MKPLGPSRAHYFRVLGMAQATGVDLVSAFDAGRLDNGTWSGMVERCRGCAWAEGCDAWLESDAGAVVPPRECLNRTRFGVLRVEQELERA
ncbi:MAG: DUF6455 family protein [Roseovarius sp.]